jgi:ABC-type uncharacterized transport system fused permease/ATPase subunit
MCVDHLVVIVLLGFLEAGAAVASALTNVVEHTRELDGWMNDQFLRIRTWLSQTFSKRWMEADVFFRRSLHLPIRSPTALLQRGCSISPMVIRCL